MIPVALLCVTASGCADQPVGPKPAGVAPTYNVPADRFFAAWSQSYADGPIPMQLFTLDVRQDRQFADYADERVQSFARANPGRLYIVGDEPDQYCVAPRDYAVWYHDFVATLSAVDPTARFSPAGFAEPNWHCCPLPDDVPAPCWELSHGVNYADQFYYEYVQRYGVAPRVNEWRFHDFGIAFGVGDIDGWWARVDRAASWSVAHGANMVLGTFGFTAWREPLADYQEHMKQAMGRLLNDGRINGAVFWSYHQWVHSPRPLANDDGSLTPEGQTYVNPLTDIPTDLKMVGSTNGQAKLRWNNTTAAWGAETEFWVQRPGSDSFVNVHMERVATLGATQTPFVPFNTGDRVKARVRYYNALGQAAWSTYSNTVTLESTNPEADQGMLSRKRPLSCFLRFC